MTDQRTMAQLLQEPTEGYEDAIVVPAITVDKFKLKHGLLTLVQNKQFFGHDKEDLHAHIRYFNKITSTLKFPNVPNTSIKLMLFPFFFEGASRIWLEKEPLDRFFTWDDLVLKFINQFFPPSKTTNLRNQITNSQQRFDESSSEGWDRFKDLLLACLHYGFSELHQLDTFYNALNSKDQDSLNSAAGVVAKMSMNTSTSSISPDVSKLKDMVKALLIDKKSQNQAPATVKAVEERCEQSKPFHSKSKSGKQFQPKTCLSTLGFPTSSLPSSGSSNTRCFKRGFSAYIKANDAVMRNMQTQGQNMRNQFTNLTELITKFVNSNCASTSSSGTLPSNTIANPRSDLKEITTRSEETKDTVHPTNNESTENVQPQVFQSKSPILTSESDNSPISEPVIAPVSAPKPSLKSSIPYPSRRNDERNREKANNQIEKFYQIFKDMSFKISFADTLILMPKFASTLKALIRNKEKLSEMARTPLNEHCSTVFLKKLPEKLGDPDFDADPRVPLILRRYFLKTERSLIDVFEDLSVEEKTALITVLKSHKRAIDWKLFDIKGIDPKFCTHKILMEVDFELAVQHQRRVNPKIHDVIKQEVIKLLDAGLIYPISDSPWVSPVDCVTKKRGFTVVENEDNELIPTRLVTCCDRGMHFFNDQFAKVMQKFSVTHRLATPYHPKVEVSNRGLKCILERTVGENHASWSDKLDDAIWAFRTAYKTLIGCTPYKLVYGKACHLPIELEHKAYWAFKHANFDLKTAGDHRKVQLNELCDQAYENSLIYKEKTKRLYDSKIKDRVFNIGDRVLLFNSRLKIFSSKLKSRWSGPFTISHVYPHGTVKLSQPDGPNFKVKCHRLKHYLERTYQRW
uniref:Reverse transcriptase domain-containing protein n=1 Tax=Tanacetum cinerariifolium TaxID=118510 RepID=A0A699GZS8_TANCI|nr:reverse transcriptase domain-containing protein [Tanacetum cinerariifolium]